MMAAQNEKNAFRSWSLDRDREVPAAEPRTWRSEAVKQKDGRITSYRLVSGRSTERVTIGLGGVDAETATRCVLGINDHERKVAGTRFQDRVLKLAAEPDGAAMVVAYLLDPGVDSLLGARPVDHEHMTLRDYWERVYWPVRSDPNSEIAVEPKTLANEKL